jgi:N-acetylglutamate synthase-like GNAT family acetyltransferase
LRRIFRSASLSNEHDREVLLANSEALELSATGVREGRTRVATTRDGTIAGFVTVVPVTSSVLELEDLFVDPDWMRRGVGRRLVSEVAAHARGQGITHLQVTANPHADAFYRNAGFIHLYDTETELGSGSRMELVV